MTDRMNTETTRLAHVMKSLPEKPDAPVCGPSRDVALSGADVIEVAELIGVDLTMVPFSIEELQLGIDVELGYERFANLADGVDGDLVAAGMLVLANLHDRADYYSQVTRAHAPCDPAGARYPSVEVGAD